MGNEAIEGIVGQLGVPGRNERAERLLETYAEQKLVVGSDAKKKIFLLRVSFVKKTFFLLKKKHFFFFFVF